MPFVAVEKIAAFISWGIQKMMLLRRGTGGRTMAEYIDREDAKSLFRAWITECELYGDHKAANHFREAIDEIDLLPAKEMVPARSGRWIHLGGDEWCCSECGFVISTEGSWEKPIKKYCEDCGAKMDLEG